MRTSLVAVALLFSALASCQSKDDKALTELVAERIGYTPNLRISHLVIFRDGDARRACLLAQWDNQWGEPQPQVEFIAWYNPAAATWFTSNIRQPSSHGCEYYRDHSYNEEMYEGAHESAKSDAAMDAAVQRMSDEGNRIAAEQAASDARNGVAEAAQEKAIQQRADAQQQRLDAEEKERERAADNALQESLKRGPVNNSL